MRRELFKIVERKTGHQFIIYNNGEIEGFGDDCYVINSFPTLESQAISDYRRLNGNRTNTANASA